MTDKSITKNTVKQYLASPVVQQRTKELLGNRASEFITSVTAMVNADNNLAQCEPTSLFMACLTAAALNLPINKNLSFAHIVPYNNNKAGVVEAQFQMGWKGYIQLAQRSGHYKTINTSDVREGEIGTRDRLSGEIEFNWVDDDKERSELPIVGYVAFFKLNTGFEKTFYMSADELKKHADKYSKAYNHGRGFGPWKDNFDAMALKTVVKLLISKWGPMSVEMQKAMKVDQAIIKDEDDVSYIDEASDIDNVNATEDKKAAIIAANTGAPVATEPDHTAVAKEVFADEQPKKESVKEKAARKYGSKNNDNDTPNNAG